MPQIAPPPPGSWHCAGFSHELAVGPLGRTLLGQRLVLFRDATGAARALGARCPHRGADLASGRIVDGCIECPFHGWRFDGGGRCVRIPSQPETVRISSSARTPSFPLHERQGTIWISTSSDEAPPGDVPVPTTAGRVRRLFFVPQLIGAPLPTVLEGAFDKAHVPFIHRGTFGPDQDPLVARRRITMDPDGRGLLAEDDPESPWHAEPRLPGGWLGRLVGLKAPIAQHMRFRVEGVTQQLYLEYPNGSYDLFVTHLTPADEGHTWLFVQSLRTRAAHAVGDWIQRRVIGRVFREGERETGLVLDAGPGGSHHPVSVESDRLGLAVRHLYERPPGRAMCERDPAISAG